MRELYHNKTTIQSKNAYICAVHSAQLRRKTHTDLAERERRAVDLFNAKEVQRIDDTYSVDNAIDRTHFVEVNLLVNKAMNENQ